MKKFLSVSVILFLLLAGCATLPLKQPELRGVHPRITGIDFAGVNMAFDVDLYNPNFFTIRAPRLRYTFDVEGARLFGAETTSSMNLPQNEVGMVTFPVRVSYLDLVRSYQALAHAPEAHYDLKGGLLFPVVGRDMEIPFSYNGIFPILRPPTFSDIKVNVAETSLFRTKINVNALAKNPNIFPLGLENLGYTLKLGDVNIGNLGAGAAQKLEAGQTAPLSFTADVSAASSALSLLTGSRVGQPKLLPAGSIKTPYGLVELP